VAVEETRATVVSFPGGNKSMIVVNTETIPGRTIREVKGLVQGNTIRAKHVGCAMIASRGLVDVWQRTVNEHRPPRMADGVRMLTLAIVIHGLYNAAVIGYETFGIPF
jgi:hypothetical protein